MESVWYLWLIINSFKALPQLKRKGRAHAYTSHSIQWSRDKERNLSKFTCLAGIKEAFTVAVLCKRPPVNANQWNPYIWKRLNECVSRKGRWRKRSRQRRRLRTCHVRLGVYLNEKQVQNYWNDNPLFGIENEWNDEVPLNVYACTHTHALLLIQAYK